MMSRIWSLSTMRMFASLRSYVLSIATVFFFLLIRPPPRSPFFPYTPLFRSLDAPNLEAPVGGDRPRPLALQGPREERRPQATLRHKVVPRGDAHRLEAVGVAAWDHLVAQSRLRSPFLTWTLQREWTRAVAADRRLEIRRVERSEERRVGKEGRSRWWADQ